VYRDQRERLLYCFVNTMIMATTTTMPMTLMALMLLVLRQQVAVAFYLPGVNPQSFSEGEK